MAPPIQAYLYCVQADVEALLSVEGVANRQDDDGDTVVSAAESMYLNNWLIPWATAKVDRYCVPLYDPVDLVTSWTVNEWATFIAAYRLCQRRANPVPTSIAEAYLGVGADLGVVGELQKVRSGELQVPDIGYRNENLPFWINLRVDQSYRLRKLRVERVLSERTPPQYPRNRDIGADYIVEPN